MTIMLTSLSRLESNLLVILFSHLFEGNFPDKLQYPPPQIQKFEWWSFDS